MSNALLVYDVDHRTILHQAGDIATRHAPCSTFKLPIAIMGFDSGILKTPSDPLVDYDPALRAPTREHLSCTPRIWLEQSIIWYSQYITTILGKNTFKTYIKDFEYGNQDVTGDPGLDNGLKRSWLSSSLQISPQEQVHFIERFLNKGLNIKGHVYDLVQDTMPKFSKSNWTVWGKTGSGFLQDANLIPNTIHPMGWFVGWAKNKDQTVAFANFIDQPSPLGRQARDEFLADHLNKLI